MLFNSELTEKMKVLVNNKPCVIESITDECISVKYTDGSKDVFNANHRPCFVKAKRHSPFYFGKNSLVLRYLGCHFEVGQIVDTVNDMVKIIFPHSTYEGRIRFKDIWEYGVVAPYKCDPFGDAQLKVSYAVNMKDK